MEERPPLLDQFGGEREQNRKEKENREKKERKRKEGRREKREKKGKEEEEKERRIDYSSSIFRRSMDQGVGIVHTLRVRSFLLLGLFLFKSHPMSLDSAQQWVGSRTFLN